MMSQCRILGVGLWLVLCSVSVQAANQCTAVFAYPVQSHASPGMLSMNDQSSVTSATAGATYPFLGKSITSPSVKCNGNAGACNVSGALGGTLKSQSFIGDPNDFPADPGGFPGVSGSKDLACSGTISLNSSSNYKNANWGSDCVANLKSGQTYNFASLTLNGATLNLNGATVNAGSVAISANGVVQGSGNLNVSQLTVSDDGRLSAASVTVYNSLSLSTNTLSNVTSVFQPHYVSSVSLSQQSQLIMAAGNWPIKTLSLANNSVMTLQGQSSLSLYALTMSGNAVITPVSNAPKDLSVMLYQTVDMNMTTSYPIKGYLQAHYLSSLNLQRGTTGVSLYFSGGSHWLKTLSMGINDQLIFDSGTAAQLYINDGLTLSDQMAINAAGPANNLMLYSFGQATMSGNAKLNAFLYVNSADLNMSKQAQLTGAVSAVNVTMMDSSQITHEPFVGGQSGTGMCEVPLTCFTDNFSATPLSNNWVVAKSSGNFSPSIVNGRLQMTQAVGNQSTSATYQRLFPAASNLITIEFDHYAYTPNSSSSGADGIAVVLSDAKATPQPGAFGGPLGYGYKTGISGFAGGWLGVGIDEYGNFSNEGGSYNIGQRPQSVAVRGSGSGTTGYRYLKGTCNNGTTNTSSCLSPKVDVNSNLTYHYRLTVDSQLANQSMVKVERNTGSGFVTLIDSFNVIGQTGQDPAPSNLLLSLTGSTGGSLNVHEIDNFQVCAQTSSGVGTQIDHFEFDHSGSALTCNPETLTIRACANPNTNLSAPCSPLITDPVTATLTPATGWLGGNPVTFSGGTTQLQLRNSTPGSVTVGVTGSVPLTKPLSSTLCRAKNGSLSTAACTLNFADAGFVFDVPDGASNQPQLQVPLKAVKKSDSSQACVPAFASQSKTLTLKGSYITPTANPFNSQITVSGTKIGMSGTGTALDLAFDANGVAKIDVNYPDAGKVQLDATYNGTSASNDAGLLMTGSDQFTATPVALCVESAAGVCNAVDPATCPLFKRTGETFPVTVTARAWEQAGETGPALCTGNIGTPNFALGGIMLGTQLVAPTGGVNATPGIASYNHVAATGGSNQIVSQSLNEVGVFKMTATLPATLPDPYKNTTIPVVPSSPVGRFVPWDFNLVSGSITPVCGAFSYMDQPFGVQMKVQARNSSGAVTQNYRNSFARGILSLVAANGADAIAANRVTTPGASWNNGVIDINGASQFARAGAADGPFRALHVGVQVADGEPTPTSFLTGMNMDQAVPSKCSSQGGANCTAKQLTIQKGGVDNTMTAYYGRLLASTGQGIASAPLALSLQTQYYDYKMGQWQLNTDDNCTSLSLTGKGILFTNSNQNENMTTWDSLTLGPNVSIHIGLGNTAPGGTTAAVTKGATQFQFSAPNITVRIPYRIVLGNEPSQPLWLADPATPNHLDGEAIFGNQRGNDRIITRRELIR